jgi:hypothetical protein
VHRCSSVVKASGDSRFQTWIRHGITLQLTGVGTAGGILTFQTSTNLIQWYTIGIVTNEAGTFQFPYPFSKSESKRFFRLGPFISPPSGSVTAWGQNTLGQTNVPPDLNNVIAIAAGGHHCLALKDDGTVIVWGSDPGGQVDAPSNLANVISISAGYAHNLALDGSGLVTAWGDNSSGQISVPAMLNNVTAISAGGFHGLVITNR